MSYSIDYFCAFVATVLSLSTAGTAAATTMELDRSNGWITCRSYFGAYKNCQLYPDVRIHEPLIVQLHSGPEAVHSKFSFRYRFNCSDRKFVLYWKSGESSIPVETSHEFQDIVLEGSHTLTLYQTENAAREAWRFHFPFHCELEVQDLDLEPSDRTVNVWLNRVAALDKNNQLIRRNLDYLALLTEFRTAFEFLQTVTEMFLEQLAEQERLDLALLAAPVLPILEELSDPQDPRLSEDEKTQLQKLHLVLSTLSLGGVWTHPDGSSKSLGDFLSIEEREQIQRLADFADVSPEQLSADRRSWQNILDADTEELTSLLGLLNRYTVADKDIDHDQN